jgi:2-methylaconitate cis-trans-isomerase PrpF
MLGHIAIPTILMRGGTSRGPYFRVSDLPADIATRDKVLLAAMGSPDTRQIDGLGGADTLTSKVAMVRPSTRPGCDVDYLFAQVDIGRAIVDTGPSCGNMLSGVAPFAIETGMVPAQQGETSVRIYDVNTDSLMEAVVQTPLGRVNYQGETAIDGVPGTSAPIILNFLGAVGMNTGKLLPSGRLMETIQGIDCTLIDVVMPMVLMRAADLGITGYESKPEIDGNTDLLKRIEAIRMEAGERMGFGDVTDSVMPKIGLLSPRRGSGAITSRYLTPHKLHAAHAVSGAVCISAACLMEGSIARPLAVLPEGNPATFWIEHPAGMIDVRMEYEGGGAELNVIKAGIVRTARPIMRGEVLVPKWKL